MITVGHFHWIWPGCVASDEQAGLEIAGQLNDLDALAERISLRADAPLFESIARLHMTLFDDLTFAETKKTTAIHATRI